MNSSQCTQVRSPSQWQNFWAFDLDGDVIDAQIAYLWKGEPISVRVMSHWSDKADYFIDLKSKRELRQFLERFDRWTHILYYHCGTHWRRIPGSIDLEDVLWRKRMTVDDWRGVVCRPAATKDWLAIARKYRVAIAMRADPPIRDGKYDRSAGIWWLCKLMLKAGASTDEIICMIPNSKPFVMKRETHGDRWAKAELKRLHQKLRRAKR